MAQIKTGTVSVTNGSNTVTGSGTTWLTDGVQAGDGFVLQTSSGVTGSGVYYTVAGVASDTSLTLSANWGGATASGAAYVIVPDFIAPGYPQLLPGDLEVKPLMNRNVQKLINDTEDGLDNRWISKYTTDQLSTATSLRAGNKVRTPGYYAAGDGGGNDGIVEERDGTPEYRGSIIFITGTTLQVRMLFPSFISFEHFGVTGNNSDQSAFTQKALNYCSENKRPILSSLKIRIDNELEIKENTTIQFLADGGFDFSNAASDGYLMRAQGSIVSTTLLTANASVGDEVISVADASSYSEGELVMLIAEDRWSSLSPKLGEFCRVLSITGNDITLRESLRDNYTTANTATLRKINTIKNIKIQGGLITGAGPSTTQIGMGFLFCENLRFDGVEVRRFGIQDIEIEDSHKVFFYGGCILGDILQASQNSYAITLFNCVQSVSISGCHFEYVRAAISSGSRLNSYGFVRDVTVTGNTCTGILGGFVRSHSGSDKWTISGNVGTANESNIRTENEFILFRGRSATIVGNESDGVDGTFIRIVAQVTNRESSFNVSSNSARNVGRSCVIVDASEIGADIKSAVVSNNSVDRWAFNAATPAYEFVATNGDISSLTVSGNTSKNAAQAARSMLVRASGGSILGGSLSINVLENTGATETILLLGENANALGGFAISGNYANGGSYGIRQTGTTVNNCLSGNVSGGSAGGYLGFSATEDKGNITL